MRDYQIGSSNNNDLCWDCSQNDFGNYLSEYNGNIYNGYHPGEDWSLPSEKDNGLRIYSIGIGKVVAIQNLDELGYLIVIEHEGNFNIPSKEINSNGKIATYEGEIVNKIYSVYLHLTLAKVNGKDLKVGDKVDENTIIGYIINPGGGSHLHFEIRKNNDNHDKSWSLIGDKSNWQIFPDDGYNGYYKDLQKMIDAGLRDPSEFIDTNSNMTDMIKKIQEN